MDWHNGYLYFFLSNGTYIKYSKSNDQAVSGYPKDVNDHNWSGLGGYGKKITAVFVNPSNTKYAYFILDDNTFIKYNTQTDKALNGYPKPINNSTWPGVLGF